jgi:hypothetical protein
MSKENKAIVTRWFTEYWKKGNVAVVDELAADNLVFYYPMHGELRGRDIGMPTHPRPLQAIFDQMPTRSLDHSATNRITRRQVLIVPHATAVPVEVVDDLPYRLAA